MDRHTLVAVVLGALIGHVAWQAAVACEIHTWPRPDPAPLTLAGVSPGPWHAGATNDDWPAHATWSDATAELVLGDGTRLETR